MDELVDTLNEAQKEAVLHGGGPLLVLAGAGSGKTRVIVHRVAHVVERRQVMPWHVLAVTFTNKAAGEMRERLDKLLGAQARELWVMTFHAFGARFLRREAARAGLPQSFPIYDDADQMSLAKRLIRDAGLEETFTPRDLLSFIDRNKNVALGPDQVGLTGDPEQRELVKLYRRYEEALRRAGAVDFGDLLKKPLELLEQDAELRERWSRRFRHLLVDEFQDTNPAQYRLIRLLAGPRCEVCVVGDDDQAIYRWRGADVSNILGFDKDFPGTRVVKLERNYRSTKRILAAAHAVIEKARRRREKKLWTEGDEGEPLVLIVARDEHEEASRLAHALAQERARGTALDEIAVLYRMNSQSRVIEQELRASRIPYVIVRGKSFYERAEIKDAAAYLRLMLSPASDLDFERVVNRPKRNLGDKTVERVQAFAQAHGLSLFEATARAVEIPEVNSGAKRRLEEFHGLVAGLREKAATLDAGLAVQEMLTATGLIDALKGEGTDEAVERAENLLELLQAAREFDERNAGAPAPRDPDEVTPSPLARFLEEIALLGEADQPTPEGRVALMTLHAAKGLEFEAVFITGLEEGTLPHTRWAFTFRDAAGDLEDLDEERRLCYVGMTRAKKRLVLSLARRRIGYGEGGPSWREMEPSRFLGDLSPSLFGLPERPAVAPAPQARAPVIRRLPGSVDGDPVIELDDGDVPAPEAGPSIDYSFDQRPEAQAGAFRRGARVRHATFGVGVVAGAEGAGPQAKVVVRFEGVGEKRVIARFLAPA